MDFRSVVAKWLKWIRFCLQIKFYPGLHNLCVYRHEHTWWVDSILPCWFFTSLNRSEMATNTTIVNEQESALAAFSQPCLSCLQDILCFFAVWIHITYCIQNPLNLHSSECFLLFYFITRAEHRTLPQWHGCHRPPGIPAHMDGGLSEAFLKCGPWFVHDPSVFPQRLSSFI